MQIIVTLDDDLAARAKALAARQQTTLEALLGDLLRRAGQADAMEEFLAVAHEHGGCSEPGWRFDRGTLYGRGTRE